MKFLLTYIYIVSKNCLVLFLLAITSSMYAQLDFRVVNPSTISQPFDFTYTSNSSYIDAWGGDIEAPGFLLEGSLELIEEDTLGCETYTEDLSDKIAFIYRGECSFYDKIYQAQLNGAKAVVIVNNEDGELFFMTGGETAYLVNIPAILISKSDGAILREAMNETSVDVVLRNLQNYFQYNLSLDSDYTLIPHEYATPQSMVSATNPYWIDLGAFVINRGSNDISAANLHAKVIYLDSVFAECSLTRLVSSGDTVFFDLPDFSFDNLDIGKYELVYYTDIPENPDQDKYYDTLKYTFEITQNRFSLCPLDSVGEPITNHYTTSAVSDLSSFTQCIKFENSNASEIAAEGIFFSVKNELDDIDQEEILISCFQWNNNFNDELENINENFSDLILKSENYYILESELQSGDFYAPFENLISLENDTKYLFCLNPLSTPDLLIGYNKNRDYTLNNYAFSESVNPIEIISFMNPQSHWYNGFSSGITPAFAIKFVDSDFLSVKEVNEKKIKIYPNPVNDVLTVYVGIADQVKKIEVIDVMGKIVLKSEVELINNQTNINVDQLEKGVYLVKVIFNDNQVNVYNILIQ